MKSIAVYNTKGGVGKSACTVFLANYLATKYEQRVLVVDLDPQQSSSIALLGEKLPHDASFEGNTVAALVADQLRSGRVPTEFIRECVLKKDEFHGRKNTTYLRPVSVLTVEPKSTDSLNRSLSQSNGTKAQPLKFLLDAVAADYDICLIDFPAGTPTPLTLLGLGAADRWLLPTGTDHTSARCVTHAASAFLATGRSSVKGLGTLMSICQNRQTGEYREARKLLQRLAGKKRIPQLFESKSELLNWNQAREAMNYLRWEDNVTLAKFFRGTTDPFYQAVRSLAHEVTKRLGISAEEIVTDDELTNVDVAELYQA